MPRIRINEPYLSSSIIIIPTRNYENLKKLWSSYNNIPEFDDLTLLIDVDEDGNRIHPNLSYLCIADIHDGSLYSRNGTDEPVDLGDELYKLIEPESQFKLHYIQIEGYGVQYTSYLYDSTGLISQMNDDPIEIQPQFYSSKMLPYRDL